MNNGDIVNKFKLLSLFTSALCLYLFYLLQVSPQSSLAYLGLESNETAQITSKPADTTNIRQVKALYLALKNRDKAALANLLVAEPTWDVTPGFPHGAQYKGMAAIFGEFYPKLLTGFNAFSANPETYVDGGDKVVVLGHYQFNKTGDDNSTSARFTHTWQIASDGRIEGVWQVADTAMLAAN